MDEYLKNLTAQGYLYIDFRQVEHHYHLVFASRHPKGLEFWRRRAMAPSNQRELL